MKGYYCDCRSKELGVFKRVSDDDICPYCLHTAVYSKDGNLRKKREQANASKTFLSPYDSMIKEMYTDGYIIREIAEILSVSESSIFKRIRDYRERNESNDSYLSYTLHIPQNFGGW